jgi:hypothetical protein
MRSDNMTVIQRVHEILAIRLQGAEFHDVMQFAADKGWNLRERQIRNYIAKSDELLAKTLEPDRQKQYNRAVAQRHALYARCMSVADLSNARGVLKDLSDLLGLYPAKKTEITGKDGALLRTENVVLTDAERQAAVERIVARAAVGPAGVGQVAPEPCATSRSPVGGSATGDDSVGDDPGSVADQLAGIDV